MGRVDVTPNIGAAADAIMIGKRREGTQLLTPIAAELGTVRQSPAMNVAAVVANCTGKKILKPCKPATPVSLTIGVQAAVQTEWLGRLGMLKPEVKACSLYTGRGFGFARQAATLAAAPLYIASAGLGLVAGDTLVPTYGLTPTGKHPDAVSARVQGVFKPDVWFEGMLGGPFSSAWTDVLGDGQGSVLIALTHPYARMLGRSLSALAPDQLARLRIFGPSLNAVLPEVLHPAIAPYDKRLDVIAPGLQQHFASRALQHFVQSILPAQAMPDRAAEFEAVKAALGAVILPNRPRREGRTDAQLLAWITARLRSERGIARLLKALRHDEGIACEQARFARLYRAGLERRAAA